MNKSLLRKIKHEGIPEVFQEGRVHSDIIYDYLYNKSYPDVNLMSDEQLETKLEEILDWNWRVLPSISPQFSLIYYYEFGGEYYDVSDEIEYRLWKREEGLG